MAEQSLVVVMNFGLEVPKYVDDMFDPEHCVVFASVKCQGHKITQIKGSAHR